MFKINVNPKASESEYESESEFDENMIIKDLPLSVARRVLALETLSDKRSTLELEFKKELAVLEKKYEAIYGPIYQERSKIINGEREVSEEEFLDKIPSGVTLVEDTAEVKGIPRFWLDVILRSEMGDLIQEHDEEALSYLRDVRSERTIENDCLKVTIHFDFNPNPFFENQTLSKTVTFNSGGDTVLDLSGTPVNWKSGKDLRVGVENKSVRHRVSGQVKTVQKSVARFTFFLIFDDISLSCCEEGEEHDHDHDHEDEDVKLDAMQIAEICSLFDKRLIPEAVEWYTMKAQSDHANMSDLEMDDDESEEDESDYSD